MNARTIISAFSLFAFCFSLLSCDAKQGDKNKSWGKTNFISMETPEQTKISPYRYLNNGHFTETTNAFSPDPLFNYRWDDPKADDSLQVYSLRPVSVKVDNQDAFRNIESLTGENPRVTVVGAGSIMMDFGVENAAWLEFESPDLCGQVSMSISEYNEPAIVNSGAQNPVKTKEPVKYGAIYRLELNNQLYEGVRFGWIHVDNFEKPWTITNVRLVCQTKPVNYNGSFTCNDDMLNRIWYTGAYTVKLNLLQDYFGAILMERSDRHSWTGDAHTSQAAALVAFGNYDFIRQNIVRTAHDDNGIAAYSLYWILSVLDYYRYTGDREALWNFIKNMDAKIDRGLYVYENNPDLVFVGSDERLGAMFENPNCDNARFAYKMLFLQTCHELAKVMKSVGKENLAQKYETIYQAKVRQVRRQKNWSAGFGMQAMANAVNAGVIAETEKNDIFQQYFADPVQATDLSPFNQYFVLNALAKLNRYDEALAVIKRQWGGQIELGATTFWELYRPEWNQILAPNDPVPNCQTGYTSLCHPWSSGATKWLTEEILGVRPTSPGFKTFKVKPHLGRTLKWVKGQAATPYGAVLVDVDVEKGVMNIEVPEQTVADIAVPKVEKQITAISVNKHLVWQGKYLPSANIDDASEDDDFVCLRAVKPGSWQIKISYKGKTPPFESPPIRYAARFVGVDSTTSGDWQGVYGQQGFVFFNYSKLHDHYFHLPAFVDTILVKTKGVGSPKDVHRASPSADSRALKTGRRESGLGALSTQNPSPCFQTFTVDILSQDDADYQVALYFVDWNNGGNRQAVEMFDYESKNLVAPVQVVEHFGAGVYFIYRYNRSARFRIDHIRGGDATLSALFFDRVEGK